MVSIEAFSELLQVLYSAPLQHEEWQRFLTLVSGYTASRNAYFVSADPNSRLALREEGGPPQAASDLETYNKDYAPTDPVLAALIRYARTNRPIGVFTDEDLLPGGGLLSTPFYQQLLVRMNLRHGTAVVLSLTLRRTDAISVWRTPEEVPIDADSRRLLELLIPHVQTALETRRVLGLTQQRLASAEAIANASSTATFVLTRKGRVQHWNTAAEALVRDRDGLMLKNGYLTASDAQAAGALANLFQDVALPAFSPFGPQPAHCLALQRTSEKRPLQVIATPLPEAQRSHSQAELVLLVTDPEKPSNFPDDLLRALYDLTPTEVDVAKGLMMGYSAQEIACLRRVSTGTVRQQIKSMLSKTGASRQSDMVRLFMTLPQVPILTT
jgi:DNA-binding CsgD family transcriptional regulator/PAS domain-containing protein